MPKLLIRFEQFVEFCRWQDKLDDHYPHVVVFKHIANTNKLTLERKLWLGLLYMAYYDDASCWTAFNDSGVKDRAALPNTEYPISKQRRNLFGGRLNTHFESIFRIKSLTEYFKCSSWDNLLDQLEAIYGNGRWASYTTAEMLYELGALSLQPNSYEIAGSSGPKRGLEFLGLPPTEQSALYIHKLLQKEGLTSPPQVVESFLCNWSRMNAGKFYAGHNLDRQQGRIRKVEGIIGKGCKALWEARKVVFDQTYLGEYQGWNGIRKERMDVYKKTHKVLVPNE